MYLREISTSEVATMHRKSPTTLEVWGSSSIVVSFLPSFRFE
jgi:hypothetical protein